LVSVSASESVSAWVSAWALVKLRGPAWARV
jgi:hypothetical protein